MERIGFVMLQLEILISYIAGPNFQFRCDERRVHTGVNGAMGDELLFEVLECMGFHLVIIELVPDGSSAKKKKLNYFHKNDRIALDCIDFYVFFSGGGGGGASPDPTRFQSFPPLTSDQFPYA